MRARWIPRSPVDAVYLSLLLWLGSDVDLYLLHIGISKPLYAYIALAIFAGVFLLMQGAAARHVDAIDSRGTRRYILWLLLYGAYGAFAFLESSQSTVAIQSLIYLCESIVLGIALTFLMFKPRRLRQTVAALALLAVFASLMDILDFFRPVFTTVPGRGAGFYANPNIAGAFVALGMVCGYASVPRRLRWLFILTCGIGVLATFSREAWLMWGAAVFWLGWQANKARPGRRWLNITLGIALGVLFLLAVFGGAFGDWLAGTTFIHYLDPNTLARLGVGASSFSGFATDQRIAAAVYAWHQFTLAPLLGHGIGYVFEWGFPKGPHNMFLRFMAEGGIVGLAWYVGLFWLLWRAATGTGRVIVLVFFIASFFSHNLLDQPEFIVVLTYVAVDAAEKRRRAACDSYVPCLGVTD